MTVPPPPPPADAAALLEHSPHAVLVVTSDGVLEWANELARLLLGGTRSVLDLVLEADRARAQELLAVVAGGTPGGPAYLRLRAGAGAGGAGQERTVAVRGAPAGPGRVQLAVADVTRQSRDRARLQHVASHDVLTDLPGRDLLRSRLEEALVLSPERVVAVLFVDLDGFKLVNDALGNTAGDAVLVEAAARLRRALRSGDTVGRWGGDEFVVVLPQLAGPQQAVEIARRLEQELRRPFAVGGDEVPVGASVGVALREPGATADSMLREADTAMYSAKERARVPGARRYEVFDAAMRERAQQRGSVARVLQGAVEEGRVEVHYQPVVDLVSRRAVGVEALARVRDGVLLHPGAFLDVALQAGLLPGIDLAVLERAVADVAGWRATTGADLDVAVNITASRVDDALPDLVAAALDRAGLPAGRLVLELTEQALVESGPRAEVVLRRLCASGVRIALDDFGTGWASLTYLRRFPVSLVKVDRSFVAGLPDQDEDCTIVHAVIDLAQQLGLQCTAEGVEREDQYERLRAWAPPFGQGFLFGRPVPAAEVPALLARTGSISLEDALQQAKERGDGPLADEQPDD